MVKSNIDKKFSAHYDAVEAELKSSTVGKYGVVAHKPACITAGRDKQCDADFNCLMGNAVGVWKCEKQK